jgi:uncharacterized membrane protein YcaP (DUF421 family)
MFDRVDWATIFVPTVPLLETFVRGTAVYLALFILLRVVLRRQAGTVGMTDLLVIVLIADAAQNAMAANYKSVPDGVLLVATIIFWCYALDWIGYRVPAIGRFVRPPPLELVRNGRMIRENMRHELITAEELMGQIREQGIDTLSKVKSARLEGDGHISVVARDDQKPHGRRKRSVT